MAHSTPSPTPTDPADPHAKSVDVILQGWDTEAALSEELREELERLLRIQFRDTLAKNQINDSDLIDVAQKTVVQAFNSNGRGSLREWKRKGRLLAWLRTTGFRMVTHILTERKTHKQEALEEHEDLHSATHGQPDAILLTREQLESLAKMIRKQGVKKPRFAALMRLRMLGAAQKTSALLWGLKDDYVCPKIKELDLKRAESLHLASIEMHRVLLKHPEVACGRNPGDKNPLPKLTENERAELQAMARNACRADTIAELARELWRQREPLRALHRLLQEQCGRVKAGNAGAEAGTQPEHHQIAISKQSEALLTRMGPESFHAFLMGALSQVARDHAGQVGVLDEPALLDLCACFSDMITATRWQTRLWQDERAIDWLAKCLVPQNTQARRSRLNTVPSDTTLKGVREALEKRLELAARRLDPLDFQPHIDASCAVMHGILLEGTRATGATLWIKSERLRALQAVFNPAEDGPKGIVGQMQPLNEGIISWVHLKERGIYYTLSEASDGNSPGISGHAGNTRPNSHSKRIDQRLGRHTQAMITIPFHCCGENRGVLSLVCTGGNAVRFSGGDRARLEAFATVLKMSIEKSIMAALLG